MFTDAGRLAPGATPVATPATILVVEDEVIVAEDIRRRLIALGYTVGGVAHSGESAITRARAVRPDLILMDIGIGGTMDGIEIAAHIRREMDVPVVFATAYSDDPTIERAKQVTPYGYVLKPFEERELRTTVEMALFNHGVGRQVRSSEQRYRTLLEEAADAILLIDRAGMVAGLNAMALALLGASRQEVMERPVTELLVAGELPAFPLPADTGARVRTEGLLHRPDGRQIPVDVNARRLEDGTVEAIVRDITEQRRVEKTLLRRLEKEHFVAEFTSRLVALTPEEAGRELPDLLASLGDFTGADRIALCFVDAGGQKLQRHHEWGKDGRAVLGAAIETHLPLLRWSLDRLAAEETVCLYQVNDLPPDAAAEGRFWSGLGVRSLAVVPVLVSRRLIGFLACTAEEQETMWNGEDLRLLRVLGGILGNVLDRLQILSRLQENESRRESGRPLNPPGGPRNKSGS